MRALFVAVFWYNHHKFDLEKIALYQFNLPSYALEECFDNKGAQLSMPGPNRYWRNCINNSLIQVAISKIACCTKNIWVINNVAQSEKSTVIVDLWQNVKLPEEYFYSFRLKRIVLKRLSHNDGVKLTFFDCQSHVWTISICSMW